LLLILKKNVKFALHKINLTYGSKYNNPPFWNADRNHNSDSRIYLDVLRR